MAADKKPVDWSAIEIDYRAGVKSLRVMAAEHGITHGAINKRAKRDCWTRDLSERIRAKAADLVSRRAVSNQVSVQKAATESQVVAVNVALQADVIGAHRSDAGKGRGLVSDMLGELASKMLTEEEGIQLARMTVLAKLGEEPDPFEAMLMANAVLKSVNLGDRAAIVKTLGQTLTWLIDAERKAFNIDDRTRGANEVVEALKRLAGPVED